MSPKIKDGDRAFPQKVFHALGHGTGNWETTGGMSLRDYFAIHAPEPSHTDIMHIVERERLANPHNEPYHNKVRRRGVEEIRCALRYEFADAMLSARGGETP